MRISWSLFVLTWIPYTQGCLVPNKIEIGPVNLTKKIFKNFVTVFSLIRYYLPLEKTGSSIWSTCLEFYKNAISFILRYDALFVCFLSIFISWTSRNEVIFWLKNTSFMLLRMRSAFLKMNRLIQGSLIWKIFPCQRVPHVLFSRVLL